MIEMGNDEDEDEESRRGFLFRALFENSDSNDHGDRKEDKARREKFCGPTTSSVNTASSKEKPDDRREHGRGGRTKHNNYTMLTRISQLETWDCGIACLLMIAQWLKDDHEFDCGDDEDCFHATIALERTKFLSDVGTESIWTSDLMRQLQSWKSSKQPTSASSSSSLSSSSKTTILGSGRLAKEENLVVFVLASKQIMGADESYRDFQYYQTAFEEDKSRVAFTFRDLHLQKVPMLQTTTKTKTFRDGEKRRGLSLSTVIEIVERDDCLAIVLLDKNCLLRATSTCQSTRGTKNDDDDDRGTSCLSYAGHYVILCGTSDDPKHVEIANSGEKEEEDKNGFCFVVCNPDPSSTCSGSNYMFVTPQRLEASWRAEGTDEDIIFLRKPTKCMEPTRAISTKTKMSLCKRWLFSDDDDDDDNAINNNTDIDGGGGDNGERDVQRKADAHRFSARIQTFLREKFPALTRLLWTVYKHHFPPVCRN